MYRFTAAVCGAMLFRYPARADFTLDLDAMAAGVGPRTKAIFLPSPNNPTGNLLSEAELDACLRFGPAVVVDEAYIEFAGLGHSFAERVRDDTNLIVLRTFSKWAGLAGLRLGYGLMPKPFADLLMVIKPPYTPNVASEVAGIASLEHKQELMKRVSAIVAERERLMGELSRDPIPDAAVVDRQLHSLPSARGRCEQKRLRDRLRKRGVFVRYFSEPAVSDCIRISVGRPRESALLLEALQNVEP